MSAHPSTFGVSVSPTSETISNAGVDTVSLKPKQTMLKCVGCADGTEPCIYSQTGWNCGLINQHITMSAAKKEPTPQLIKLCGDTDAEFHYVPIEYYKLMDSPKARRIKNDIAEYFASLGKK